MRYHNLWSTSTSTKCKPGTVPPVRFEDLDARAAAKVRVAIARMETGNFGDVKPVGEGDSERRIDFGPGYRVYFGQEGQRLVIQLVGGPKTRQQRDTEQARAYWRDYNHRKKGG